MEASTTCFQWTKPIRPHSPSSYRNLASAVSSPKRRCRRDCEPTIVCSYVHRLDKSGSSKLHRSQSTVYAKPNRAQTLKRACSASSSNAFSDEEFSKEIQELALRFQNSNDGEQSSVDTVDLELTQGFNSSREDSANLMHDHRRFPLASVEPPWPEISRESPVWQDAIERKANSVDIPLSLRMIKRKMQWQEGFRDVGESACSSVKKAFSSMVFMIQELHSYSMLMREFIFTEDLQGILARVQEEMHASFVWLFQQVFSQTPALMVSVMILLANFTVYSMGTQAAFAAPSTIETVSVLETQGHENDHFPSSMVKIFPMSSPGDKSASVGGNINGGGGGKVKPVGSGTEGDGSFDQSDELRTIFPDGASELSALGTNREAEQVINGEEDASELWNSIVEEASSIKGININRDAIDRFVSPIEAKIESDDCKDYLRTEQMYQTGLAEEPNNPLLLANYAQFLCVVSHNYDRAEEYYKRAIGAEPADAEAFNKYANFLWKVRDDLCAAEETFLEAIAADPTNPFYAASYASFLWTTGGEDTCFPLEDNAQQV